MNAQTLPSPMKTILHLLGLLGTLTLVSGPIVAAPTIPNPSFEANSFTAFPGYVNQGGNGTINDWTAIGGAGLNPAGGSPFADNGTVPNGGQIAFIQNGVDASLSTVISGLTAGASYKVSFRVNARSGNTPNLKIDINGNNIISTAVTPVGAANPYKYFAFDFTANAASQTMTLRNDAGGDNTVVLDDFSIETRNSGWSYAAWNDDSTSGVDGGKTYTHAYSFGAAVDTVINGITFTGVGGGNPSSSAFSTAGLAAVFNGDGNNITGGSRQLANDFLYNGFPASITINGLIPGTLYVATIYSVGWENGTRAATFSVGNDRLTVNQDQFGDNNGIRFSYRYVATGTSITLTYTPLEGNSIHTYGFSNYQFGPPQIANPSFEVDPVPGFPGYGPITAWAVTGGGINNSGGPFHDNGAIPNGAQIAFIQTDGAMSQVVSGFVPGSSYRISYAENSRNCCGGSVPFCEVKIGGQTIVAAHPVPPVGGANPYHQVTSDSFVAAGTDLLLEFIKSNSGSGDNTLLLDNVAIVLPNTPPTIAIQPQSQSVGTGETVTFSTLAGGSGPISYQWRKGTSDLPGQIGPTLTLNSVTLGDSGSYLVHVSNPFGALDSAVATLVVRETVTTVFNTGVDDSRIALLDGLTDPHYTLLVNPDSATPTALVQDSTAFPIVTGPWVANNGGSKWIGPRANTSAAAGALGSGGDYVYRTVVDLTGFEPSSVVITGDWATDNEGRDIFINGTSTGQGNTITFPSFTPFTISSGFAAGWNTVDFKLNNAAAGYTGLRVDHIRAVGTALPAGTAPFIVQQPQPFTATLGERVTYTVRANGSPALTYQWFFGFDPLPGETAPTLSFTLDFPDQAGDYSVEITSPFGSAHSDAATLILRAAPAILTQPQSQAVAGGDSVTFSVTANGFEPLEYQWTKGGVNIAGANGPTFTLNTVTEADAGEYRVRVSNEAGNVTSSIATLAVLQIIPGVFNTGVDASGVSLPSGTVDAHWTITQSADPAFPGPDAVVLNDVGFPIPPWLANDDISKWIAPQANQSGGNLEGNYNYRTSIDLNGFDPATVRLTGEWATDNIGLDILVNGTSTGQRNDSQFVVWTPFSVTSGFVPGVNVLDFRVNNAPSGVNPTGFRVQSLRALGVRLPAPTVACPGNIVAECTGGRTIVEFTASAHDAAGAPIGVTCTPPSGSGFLIGQTAVQCVAGSPGNTASCSFTVNVVDTSPPVIHCNDNIVADATSPSGAVVNYVSSAADPCGIRSLECVPSGNQFPMGVTTVTCTAVDGVGLSSSCSFTVTVRSPDQPPTAVIKLDQLVDFSPDFENPVLISCNWWNSCLKLDGSMSSDPENGALTYLWFVDSNPVPFAAAPTATNCLELGTYSILLAVTDPAGQTGMATKTIEIITAPLAIEILIEKINQSSIPRRTKRELVATLRVALTQAGYDHHRQTQVALSAFEKKVRAQVVSGYPALATSWIRWSQAVTEGMENCIKPPTKPKGGTTKGKGGDDGNNNEPN